MADLIYPPRIPGVQDKELVVTIKEAGFRRFTKQLMSECRKPEQTGVCLQPAAVEAIQAKYGITVSDAPEAPKKRKADGHRFTNRAGCRLSDERTRQLELYIQRDKRYHNRAELVDGLLAEYEKRRAREEAREFHCLICDSVDDLIFVDGTAICRRCAAKISICLDRPAMTSDR